MVKYVIAMVALFFAGWFAHSAYTSKELADALQKAGQKHQILKATHDNERTALERKIALDSAKAESRLGKILAENDRLWTEAAHIVSAEFLVFAGLRDSPDTLPNRPLPPTVPTETETSLAGTTSQEIYELIRTLDGNIIQANFRLEQLTEQVKACRMPD